MNSESDKDKLTLATNYVKTFSSCWQLEDPELFLKHFCESMTSNIRLEQPLMPISNGHKQFSREFRCLKTFIPDLKGTVKHWSWNGDYLYIELSLGGTLGKNYVEWNLLDRLKLDEQGKCSERISYFDPLPLILRIILTPTSWFRLFRSGMIGLMIKGVKPITVKKY